MTGCRDELRRCARVRGYEWVELGLLSLQRDVNGVRDWKYGQHSIAGDHGAWNHDQDAGVRL